MQTLGTLMRNSHKVVALRPSPPTNPSATVNNFSFLFTLLLFLSIIIACRDLLFEGLKKLWDTISISIPAERERSVLLEATDTKADCS